MGSRKGSLGFLNLTPQLLDGTDVLAEILALLLLVELDEVLHDALVEVLSSKMGVSVGGDDLEEDSRY